MSSVREYAAPLPITIRGAAALRRRVAAACISGWLAAGLGGEGTGLGRSLSFVLEGFVGDMMRSAGRST